MAILKRNLRSCMGALTAKILTRLDSFLTSYQKNVQISTTTTAISLLQSISMALQESPFVRNSRWPIPTLCRLHFVVLLAVKIISVANSTKILERSSAK